MKDRQLILAECIDSFNTGLDSCHRPEDRVLIEKYLSALAVLLAKLILEQNVTEVINDIERLFGTTWVIDIKPFEEAFSKWQDFKQL